MHELSISEAVVNTVIKHARDRRVRSVVMTVGALRQVVPDSLEFYFGIVSRDTICEGAVLYQTLVSGRVRCEDCGEEWELGFPAFLCGNCGGRAHVVQGNELEVESIEVEEEVECTAQR